MKSIHPITYPPRLKSYQDYNLGLKALTEPAENAEFWFLKGTKGLPWASLHFRLYLNQIP